MPTEFPSMPPYEPCTPEQDGFPYVRVAEDKLILDFGGDHFAEIPFKAILKGSILIRPGDNNVVNRFQVTFLTSGISVDDDSRGIAEIMVQDDPTSVIDGKHAHV